MTEKKKGNIQHQIVKPIIIFMIIMIVVNAIVLLLFSTSYYLKDQYREAAKLATNSVAELEKYESIGWLCEYWEAHGQEMDLVYDDTEILDEMDRQLRRLQPQIGELESVSGQQLSEMDDESQKLFAELAYSSLSEEFDMLKRAHKPLYLYSFKIEKDRMIIFVTGTTEDEKRTSQGGDLFELGVVTDFQEGAYPVVDEIIRTGKPVDKMELSRQQNADHSVIHAFAPVSYDGQLKAIVGVSFKSSEMIDSSVNMMWTMLLVTLVFMIIMLIVVIYHIRKIVVLPIDTEQKIMEEYEHTKDSLMASRALGEINTDNEIERMAESFSSMVTELDRYMEEIQMVTAEKERIGAELQVATQIQAAMLPREFPPFPERKEFDLYATMTPAKEVGGDFYNFFLTDEDHIALVIGDVSGKGVPAALFMMITDILITSRTKLGGSPGEILSYVNDTLCEHNDAEMFVTVWMAIIEISTGKGVAANAGHEHPAIKRADGSWELVEYKHSPAVATMEGLPFRDHEFEINPGDSLFVYTDGVAEATNSSDELYGTDRMIDALQNCTSEDPEALLGSVKRSINTFVQDAPQFDDITMLGFYYRGKDRDV